MRRTLRLLCLLSLTAACAGTTPPPVPAPGDPPVLAGGEPIPWDTMLARLGEADVVFLGEQHDDAAAHRLQLRLLRELGATRPAVLGMEMFERDVQPLLDEYLAGRAAEAAFLAGARPWPNYADYRPLVEVARERGWKVIATNVPRRLASAVARAGLDTLAALPPEERAHAAAAIECPEDEYFRRFTAEMGEHPGMSEALVKRMYLAQCVKDETMAESIAARARTGTVLVHLNGAFHTDQRLGIVPRLLRRRPDLRVVVVSLVRGTVTPATGAAPGDFTVLTAAGHR